MTEQLLHFIWQFQYFNQRHLETHSGVALRIIRPGVHNSNQGPDFLDAAISLDRVTLVGSIELHCDSADWHRHRHSDDRNYNNVILHVVWKQGMENELPFVPVLVLQDRVAGMLLKQYEKWMGTPVFIACAPAASSVPALTWLAWKDRMLAERLHRKSAYVLQLFRENKGHWETTCWQMMARGFGMAINGELFEQVARSLPLTILARHRRQVILLEALLLGQAGMLETDFEDPYPRLLQREYRFLRHKYTLVPPPGKLHFLRMRPAGFPTIRLAQLAMLVHQSSHLFSCLKACVRMDDLVQLFKIVPNDYWHYHYRPGDAPLYSIKQVGQAMIDHLIVNAVVPLLFACGDYQQDPLLKERALLWLEQCKAEKNAVARSWQQIGVQLVSAQDSQALLELKQHYCDQKRCLQCAIGNFLLKEAGTAG
jgi:hypothetical protein